MARYIDAEKIDFRLGVPFQDADGELYIGIRDIRKAIAQTPTADVVEVRRGEWLTEDCETQPLYKCSVCGKLKGCASDYCSSCGAYMKGE